MAGQKEERLPGVTKGTRWVPEAQGRGEGPGAGGSIARQPAGPTGGWWAAN